MTSNEKSLNDYYLTPPQHSNLSNNSQSIRWLGKSTDASLESKINQILINIRANDVNYEETLTKVNAITIICEKIVKGNWPIEYIESQVQNWVKDLFNNSSFQKKVEHILKQKEIMKRASKLPFMKEENGLSCDQKFALLSEINRLTDKIILKNWNKCPESHHQFVSGTLVSNALYKLIDCTKKDRQRILLRWANELYDSSAFRREIDSFLKENPEYMPKKLMSDTRK